MKKIVLLLLLCSFQYMAFSRGSEPIAERAKIIQAFNSDDNQLLKLLKSDTTNKFLGDVDLRFWIEAIQKSQKAHTKPQRFLPQSPFASEEIDIVMDSMEVRANPDIDIPINGAMVRCIYNNDILLTELHALVNFKSKEEPSTDSLVYFGSLHLGYDAQKNINYMAVYAIDEEGSSVKQFEADIAYNANGRITGLNAYLLMDAEDEELTQFGTLSITYDGGNRITHVVIYAYDYDLEAMHCVLVANASYNASALPTLTEAVIYQGSESTQYEGARITWSYSNDMIDELLFSALDEDSAWVYVFRDRFSYNIDKTVSLIEESEYDADNTTWIYDYKKNIYYTDFGLIDHSIELEYNTDSNDWLNSAIDSFAYNSDHQLIQSVNYEWSNVSDIYFWKYSAKQQFSYDAGKRPIKYIDYYGSYTYDYDAGLGKFIVTPEWIIDDSIQFSRNLDGKLIAIEGWDYDGYDEEWKPFLKDTITYDNQHRLNGFEQYYWEDDTLLVGEINVHIDRDANDNLSYVKVMGWNDTLEIWDQFVEVTIEYDPNAILVKPEFEIPDYVMTAVKKVAYSFGLNIDSLRHDFYPNPILSTEFLGYSSVDDILDQFQINNLPTNVTVNVDMDDFKMDELGVCNMYYSQHIIDFEHINYKPAGAVTFYPNPATDYIEVTNIANEGIFTIYSLSGVLIIQEVVSSNTKVDVSYLKPGMYITTLEINGQIQNSKLIIQ